MDIEKKLKPYLRLIDDELSRIHGNERVTQFYEPIRYVLGLKSKKIRPLLVMLSAGAVRGNIKDARFPAAAVELLHDFTLVHDDIMDNDNTRRGLPTVHVKWDINTAILAGDGLVGFAFQKLLKTPSGPIREMASRFTDAMIVICEGQGLDKMFEDQAYITVDDYNDMIARKTAALIELSCELGAMAGNGSESDVRHLREFGFALGMGFQIQDDLLDIMADENLLGKKVGSDFAMHKQTILTLKLQERIGREKFNHLKLEDYRSALSESRVLDEVTSIYEEYFKTAYSRLKNLPQNDETSLLYQLTDYIKNRSW